MLQGTQLTDWYLRESEADNIVYICGTLTGVTDVTWNEHIIMEATEIEKVEDGFIICTRNACYYCKRDQHRKGFSDDLELLDQI